LVQVSDEGAIVAVISRVLDANPGQVEQFLSGKEKVFGFFVGQIMRESGGKLNPGLVNDLLKRELVARKKP
jgi:aspartyl-tRNA(Asn)/glutamyl-tRNA(Gln) amidotransferase subunit B